MGEVYRARDTRLGRIVAIKLILSEDAENTQARLLFEREARAIAALNHPRVCGVHDVGRHGAHDFLVMEYPGRRNFGGAIAARATGPS